MDKMNVYKEEMLNKKVWVVVGATPNEENLDIKFGKYLKNIIMTLTE